MVSTNDEVKFSVHKWKSSQLPKVTFRRHVPSMNIMYCRQPLTLNKYGVLGRYQKATEHCYGSTNRHIPASSFLSSRGVETLNNHISFDKCSNKNAKCFERCGDSQERHLWESGIEAEDYLNSEKKNIPGRRNSRQELGALGELKGGPRA